MRSLNPEQATPFTGPDGRREARRSMFVAAVLKLGDQPFPVRIRNMSTTGALLEGAILPPSGSRVELVRAGLAVNGQVAWAMGAHCGIKLDLVVTVDSWLSGKAAAHQQQVDAMLAEVRRDLHQHPATPDAAEPVSAMATRDSAAAADLADIARMIGELGDGLASDPLVLARHMAGLQLIDEAQQRLAALQARLNP